MADWRLRKPTEEEEAALAVVEKEWEKVDKAYRELAEETKEAQRRFLELEARRQSLNNGVEIYRRRRWKARHECGIAAAEDLELALRFCEQSRAYGFVVVSKDGKRVAVIQKGMDGKWLFLVRGALVMSFYDGNHKTTDEFVKQSDANLIIGSNDENGLWANRDIFDGPWKRVNLEDQK